MSRKTYKISDRVVLRTGITGMQSAPKSGSIVGVLPASDRGEVQYRIRYDDEKFDRRIVESEIEGLHVPELSSRRGKSASGVVEPWFKPSSIRVAK